MRLRVLSIGDDLNYMMEDGALLRAHGLNVYFCSEVSLLSDLLDEIKPDVLFVNSKVHNEQSTEVYHRLLDNVRYASIPVIYTLSVKDVYLVNRKRTALKEVRYITANSVIDAIKMALVIPQHANSGREVAAFLPQFDGGYLPHRA